jgi:hypothetical protein
VFDRGEFAAKLLEGVTDTFWHCGAARVKASSALVGRTSERFCCVPAAYRLRNAHIRCGDGESQVGEGPCDTKQALLTELGAARLRAFEAFAGPG